MAARLTTSRPPNWAKEFLLSWTSRPGARVLVRDLDGVEAKLDKMVSDGPDKLHVISDFDMTMTKYWVDGKRNMSSHSFMETSLRLPEEFRAKTKALLEYYYPKEVDSSLSRVEKTQYMVEWWTKAHELLVSLGITRKEIGDIVKETNVVFRQGLDVLLKNCNQKKVPFLVFSAGLADIIEEVLAQRGLWLSNMHVVSNRMRFEVNPDGSGGKIIGFYDPLIHVMNKDEGALVGEANEAYVTNIKERRHTLLLGDSLGDLTMSRGIRHDTCLTIGFLNYKEKEYMAEYQEKYDIILLDDPGMEFPTAVLDLF